MARKQMSLDAFIKELRNNVAPEMRDAAVRGLQKGARFLEMKVVEAITDAKPYPAVNTGNMRNSVEVRDYPDGAEVNVTAPYASHMEYGTRPFHPPIAPLKEWARLKFGDENIAYAVANSIAKNGIKPRRFMKKAVKAALPTIIKEVESELRRS